MCEIESHASPTVCNGLNATAKVMEKCCVRDPQPLGFERIPLVDQIHTWSVKTSVLVILMVSGFRIGIFPKWAPIYQFPFIDKIVFGCQFLQHTHTHRHSSASTSCGHWLGTLNVQHADILAKDHWSTNANGCRRSFASDKYFIRNVCICSWKVSMALLAICFHYALKHTCLVGAPLGKTAKSILSV